MTHTPHIDPLEQKVRETFAARVALIAVSPELRPAQSRRPGRLRLVLACALVSATVLALAFGTVAVRHARHEHAARLTVTSPAPTATTKPVSYRGVQLSIPVAWPVIDGAHAGYPCLSTFTGQADRAFLGTTYQNAPSCPSSSGGPPPPPADGVWMQPGGSGAPAGLTATTLPSGQVVHQVTDTRSSAVTVWFHQVLIYLGIGADPAVEQKILDSITYTPTTSDTAVLGRCPAPNPARPTMPTPTRLTTPLQLNDVTATMLPEPANVQPKVSAESVWESLFQYNGGQNFAGAMQWSITFGNFSASAPAHINKDGSLTPFYQSLPTWLIRGQGVPTSEGPCGATVIAPYDARNGESMGVTNIG